MLLKKSCSFSSDANRAPQLKAIVRFTTMWPFKKNRLADLEPAKTIGFTQVDTTERFGDDLWLDADDWIETVALNTLVSTGESMGLPAIGACEEDVYAIASQLSSIRESIEIPNDGVYCPTCHIANVNFSLLRTPCPKCGKELLKFWVGLTP